MNIGFIGLGNVGGKLAGTLLRNGWRVTVFDLDREKMAEFEGLGAIPGEGPAQMMAENDAVFTCLPRPDFSAQTVEGLGGLLLFFRHLNLVRCTFRKNSLETAYKWKKQLPIKTAQLIDEACKMYYPIIGYQSIENGKQLQNMTNYHRSFNTLA